MIKDRPVTNRKKRPKKMRAIQTIEIMIENTKKEMRVKNQVK